MHSARQRRLRLVAGTAILASVSTAGLAYAGASIAGVSLLANPQAPATLAEHGGARLNAGDKSATIAKEIKAGKAKNVILLIGDGMGDSEITSARYYAEGAGNTFQGIDALPLTGQYTTYSLTRSNGRPDYVPDSAATGSAWSTGTKTYDNAVSVNLAGAPQKTLLELAKENGLKTGDVTTSELQDATPAVQVAHISARSCYGPVQTATTCASEALENGGLGSITEQLIKTRPDVTLGGGATTFDQTANAGPYAGQTLKAQALARGYQIVSDKDALAAVAKADQTQPLLGLFAPGNLPVRYVGPAATNGGAALPPVSCTPNPAQPATQPQLAEMTAKAIKLLDNPHGFFLQVEGASIDKQDHASDACGQIGEVVDLDEAVQVAMAFARKNGNTSVFVTADHAHTSQIIEVGSASPGKTVSLITADGAPMAINYATSTGTSQQHTGTQLRIAGYGPQAANIVGLTDQTDLFFTIKNALSLQDDAVNGSNKAKVTATPAKAKPGRSVKVVADRYDGDRTVTVTVTGGGRTTTATLELSGGYATYSFSRAKAGTYTVKVTGTRSGVIRTATVTVKK